MTAPRRVRRPARKKAVDFWWFQGASVRELYDQLSAAGPDTCRLEVHPAGNKITLLVEAEVSTQSHTGAHINDAHPCPPDCPGGG